MNERCLDDKKVIYITIICSGQYDCYHEHSIFATLVKEKADMWCERYNRIIKENMERSLVYQQKTDWDKPEPFLYDILVYDNPFAIVREVECR